MKCPKHQKRYYEAFYGVAPPDHLYRKVHKLFEAMIDQFTKDLEAEFPKISQKTMNNGLIAGLEAMREGGAERPTAYGNHENMTATALKAACARIRGILKTLADKKRAEEYTLVEDDALKEMIAYNQSLKANVMIELEGHIKQAITDGVDDVDAKVMGYVALIENHSHPEGYLYALLGFIIPNNLGVYWDERVVDAMNAHPSLRKMNHSSKPGALAGAVADAMGGVV